MHIDASVCVQIQWEENAGTIACNGILYSLKQTHWHSPSEHTVDGKRSISFLLLLLLPSINSFYIQLMHRKLRTYLLIFIYFIRIHINMCM